MNLVRLGRTTINLDRVTRIHDYSTRDESGAVTKPLFRIEFDDRDFVEITQSAEDLRAWLQVNSTDLVP